MGGRKIQRSGILGRAEPGSTKNTGSGGNESHGRGGWIGMEVRPAYGVFSIRRDAVPHAWRLISGIRLVRVKTVRVLFSRRCPGGSAQWEGIRRELAKTVNKRPIAGRCTRCIRFCASEVSFGYGLHPGTRIAALGPRGDRRRNEPERVCGVVGSI